jgi:hypothetical protein
MSGRLSYVNTCFPNRNAFGGKKDSSSKKFALDFTNTSMH